MLSFIMLSKSEISKRFRKKLHRDVVFAEVFPKKFAYFFGKDKSSTVKMMQLIPI